MGGPRSPGVRGRGHAIYVVGLLAVANFLNYASRNVLFPVYPDLRAQFGFSNAELGLLGSVFMATHALATLPFGWAGDRFDRRRVMVIGILLWSGAAIAGGAATGLGTLATSRALVGIGTAACVPVANAILCELFPPADKARVVSFFNLGLFLGGAAAFALGSFLGYPLAFMLIGAPGVIVAAIVLRLDIPPRRTGAGTMQAPAGLRAFVAESRELLRIRTLRWLLLGATVMAFAAGGYTSWFFEFVSVTKGFGPERANVLFGAALIGGLLGVLAGGWFADKLRARVPHGRLLAMTIGMLVAVPFALLSIFIDEGALLYVASWLTMFFITWYHGPMAASADDLVGDDRAATAQGLVIFTMHLFGTTPSSFVIGEISDAVGLRWAMLVPTVAVGLAGLILVGGYRSFAADQAAAHGAHGAATGSPAGAAI